MNNHQGNAPRRPSAPAGNGQRPTSPSRPVNRSGAQRQPGARPPQSRPPQPNRRPPAQNAYSRSRKRRVSTEGLSLILIILSIILVALIITFAVMKSDGCSSPSTPSAESSSEPSVEAGVTDPENESSSSPSSTPNTPDVPPSPPETDFVPVSDSSTVDLAANEIYSDYIMMVDLKTGKVVCQHNPDATIYPASMTKVMTAIVARDLIDDMNDTFTLTAEIVNPLVNEGASMAGFKVGHPIAMTDLIYGTLLPSGADATAALSIALCGSEAEFVKEMNKKAAEIGCTKTNFTNASGLHDKNHYSTVRDMAIIMAYAMNDPFLREVMSAESYKPEAPLAGNATLLKSTWKGHEGSYTSDKAEMIAAKTGWTPEAGNCLASLSVTEDGKEFVIISAKATTNEQISGKSQAFSDAAKLCDKYIK